MKVRVLLFASLRERAGVGELTIDNLPDGSTLEGLKAHLSGSHPELGPLDHVAGVLAEEYVPDSTLLQEGQEVALLPPVSGGEEDPLHAGLFELESKAIDIEALRKRVEHDTCGAVVLFSGNVRETNRGSDVTGIDYEAFAKMAYPEMGRIFERCRAEHGDPDGTHPEFALRMLCVHRVGHVGVGESSVLVAVASPHRDRAFLAARFLIDELKASLPVWKKEMYSDGHHWIGDRS
jgi:MoaE-MoaD fusion protein